jgi:thiamine-phosphate pyrophosphorylase
VNDRANDHPSQHANAPAAAAADRIIDANLNRAREALRVLEDLARFALNSPDVSARLKALRHGLQDAATGLGIDRLRLLAARDTEGDVGTTITTANEGVRADLRSLGIANAMRLTEALRSIEEAAKLHPSGPRLNNATPAPNAWAAFESLRYRAYEVEKVLVPILPGVGPGVLGGLGKGVGGRPQFRLCVLLTESLCKRPWLEVARAAIEGGADCLQLREKNLDGGELLSRARQLVELASQYGHTNSTPTTPTPTRPAIFINDRPDIALLAGADGVHVGQTDLPIQEVRRLAGPKLLIGVSTGNLADASAAVEAGADLCGVGPMFHTTTKDKPILAGTTYLKQYLAAFRVPHLAIGGITPANVGQLVDAGCRGIAVSSVVCGADDPAAICRQLLRTIPAVGP